MAHHPPQSRRSSRAQQAGELGRQPELQDALRKRFPEYFRQSRSDFLLSRIARLGETTSASITGFNATVSEPPFAFVDGPVPRP